MRILHVTDLYRPDVGGIELFVEDLAQRQAAAGHEVTVLTATPDHRGRADGTAPDGVRVVRIPSRPPLHPFVAPEAIENAVTAGYDIVHAHLSVLSVFATLVARATDEAGIPTVTTVHSMWAGRRPVVHTVRVLADWNRANIVWTTVSRVAAADMVGLVPRDATVHVVPNAVDVGWWRAGAQAAPGDRPVTFLSVMRLAPRKRPFAFLSMLERARAEVPADVALRALIVGDGKLERRMEREVRTRGLGEWVTLLGRRTRPEIRALYAEADVFVAPAQQESFGIAALEARSAGLPVVAMRAGGVGEFVRDGVEGLLCRDDEAMGAALARLAVRDHERTAITAYNRAHPPTCDWPRVVGDFDRVYAEARRGAEVRRPGGVIGGRR